MAPQLRPLPTILRAFPGSLFVHLVEQVDPAEVGRNVLRQQNGTEAVVRTIANICLRDVDLGADVLHLRHTFGFCMAQTLSSNEFHLVCYDPLI